MEYYHFPHIQLFDSWEHLLELLDKADFQGICLQTADFLFFLLLEISRQMKAFNEKHLMYVQNQWLKSMEHIVSHQELSKNIYLDSYEEQMLYLYNKTTPDRNLFKCSR